MPPPLPISNSAVERLGRRLAAHEDASDEDRELLLQVLSAYSVALVEVQERLRAAGFEPTSREKTTDTLVQKLRRERSNLRSVQDIAGARITLRAGGRREQDIAVEHVRGLFLDGLRPPRVRDRRTEPSAGYRAVHVVVTCQGLPVEIQVRTQYQDRWAQVVERLGDLWGRGIRYGEPPEEPERVVVGATTRRQVWELVEELSETIDEWERVQAQAAPLLEAVAQLLPAGPSAVVDERATVQQALATSEGMLSRSLAGLAALVDRLEEDR